MPPSTTMVRRGACRRWASAVASIGAPTPVNTVWPSRSSRAPMTASSSLVVTPGVIARAFACRSRRAARRSCGQRSSTELLRALAGGGQRVGAEQLQVLAVRRGAVDVAVEVAGDAIRAALADSVDVFAEVSRIRVVQTVALVRIASVRHVDQRIDGEARDHGPVRVSPDV